MFAFIGDFGQDGSNEASVAALVKSWKPAFVVTLGDNNYNTGSAATIDDNIGKHYAEFIGAYKGSHGSGSPTNRFWPSLGNHDWDNGNVSPYTDYFDLPGNERYYDVVIGDVHLFAIDTDRREPDGTSATSVQGQWLQNALATSTSCFDIVFGHHPPYSSGQHGSSTYLRWPYAQWGADAFLAGHDHTYEHIIVDGFDYIVNGLGGRSKYLCFGNIAGSQGCYNDKYGALKATVEAGTLTFEFYSIEGELIDSFELEKACD